MSRAEKRRAERDGDTPNAVDEMVGNGVTPINEGVQSRVAGWPYHGHIDAGQGNTISWDAKLVVHPRKKVAIVGFTPTRAQAPFADPEYEVWCENALFVHPDVPRWTRWFDLHPPEIIDEHRVKFYRDVHIPVFLQDVREDVPDSVKFPKSELEQFVAGLAPGSANMLGDYQTNSISWMILMAMWEGFTTIDIYGVDMSQQSEYVSQRPNVEYFLGMCRGCGIEVNIPVTSDLLSATHQYGYGTDNGFRAKCLERKQEFQERLTNFNQEITTRQEEIRQIRLECARLDGVIQGTDWALQRTVADHTSMTPDLAKVAPELAAGTEVMTVQEVQAADAAAESAQL